MYYLTVFNEIKGDFQDITCPEFLRISEGPRLKVIKKPWLKNQKFYYTLDLDTGKEFYKTTSETRTLCGMAYDGFRKKMKSKALRSKAIRARFLVNRIPKIVFIAKTGRKYDEQREYFYKY